MNINIDANEIIENLLNELKIQHRENAVLKAQIKSMNDLLETQVLEKEDSISPK